MQHCTLADIVVDGQIEYNLLVGKILMVKNLYYLGNKWIADGTDISFYYPFFYVYVKNELRTKKINLSTILYRIKYNNLQVFTCVDTEIQYDDYKKLIKSSFIKQLSFDRITVKYETGTIYKADRIWSDISVWSPNLECLFFSFKRGELTYQICENISELVIFPKLRSICIALIGGFDYPVFKNGFAEFIYFNRTICNYELQIDCTQAFYESFVRIKEELEETFHSTFQLSVKKI